MGNKAQAGLEAVIVISVVLLLIAVVYFELIERGRQMAVLDGVLGRQTECNKIAAGASEAYSSGAYSEVTVYLRTAQNVTVAGQEGIVWVGTDPESSTCPLPAGVLNHTAAFHEARTLRFVNSGGQVVAYGS